MSYLSSVLDVVQGWPNASALSYEFNPKNDGNITEGTIVKVSAGTLPGKSVVEPHTSTATYDCPWLVIRGKETFDSVTTKKLSCLRMRTGFVFDIVAPNLDASVSDLVYANNGTLTKTPPVQNARPVGLIIGKNPAESKYRIVS